MAKAINIINRAHKILLQLGVGDTLEAELATDGLEALNAMLDSWSLDGLLIYAMKSNTFNLTSAQTYTVGTGGVFNMSRPDRIESAFCTISGIDYPLSIMDTEQWNLIPDKNISAIPYGIKYDAFTPLGLLSVYPKSSSGTITLNTFTILQSFADLQTDITLPRGYERAFAYNLAPEIAPQIGAQVSRELMMIAISSKAQIRRINLKAPILQIDNAYLTPSRLTSYNGIG